MGAPPAQHSGTFEFRFAFGVKGFDTFPEIIGRAEPAVGIAFDLDARFQRRVLSGIQYTFDRPLGQWGECAEFIHELIYRCFQLVVVDTVENHAPVFGFVAADAAGTKRHILGPLNSDHMQQTY